MLLADVGNLEWLRDAWLQDRRIAYWGDLDTWGLLMLSRARERQPHLESPLMSWGLFDALAPTLPRHASEERVRLDSLGQKSRQSMGILWESLLLCSASS